MRSELLIRPGKNDHRVVADLLAPGGAAILLPNDRPLISRLVIDAHIARERPALAESAAASGTPVLIDPLTPLWQGELRADDKWGALPFGVHEKLSSDDLADVYDRERITQAVVDFQVEQGATAIIRPYAYASGPDDPWFERSIQFLRATARYMARNGIHLALVPLFCGQLQRFGDRRNWASGIDRFRRAAIDYGPQAIGFCASPAGAQDDSYAKILRLFDLAARLRESGVPLIAWRQGVYGPALTAAGLDGYETGIATRELCDVARSIASRKPLSPGAKRHGGAIPGIYIEPLRRTVSARVGLALLGDRMMRPKVMCDDERCCPNGVADTIDRRREHAVRSRAKELVSLDAQPHTAWKLHQIARDARVAADLASQATQLLKKLKVPETLNPRTMEELARVTDFIRQREGRRDAA